MVNKYETVCYNQTCPGENLAMSFVYVVSWPVLRGHALNKDIIKPNKNNFKSHFCLPFLLLCVINGTLSLYSDPMPVVVRGFYCSKVEFSSGSAKQCSADHALRHKNSFLILLKHFSSLKIAMDNRYIHSSILMCS